MKSAEELWQSMVLERPAGVEQTTEWPADEVVKPVTRKAFGNQPVVVRPHRTVVVRHRIVAGLDRRERADPPTREHVAPEQPFGNASSTMGRGDAAKQTVSGV